MVWLKMSPLQRRTHYCHGFPALPPPTQVSSQGSCSELLGNVVHQNKLTAMRINGKSAWEYIYTDTFCTLWCHFLQEYLHYKHSFSSEANEVCKCHLPNPWEFMATGEVFSNTLLLLTGWGFSAKIGTVMSLKMMPRVDTAHSVLQKTNCSFTNVSVNSTVISGY